MSIVINVASWFAIAGLFVVGVVLLLAALGGAFQ